MHPFDCRLCGIKALRCDFMGLGMGTLSALDFFRYLACDFYRLLNYLSAVTPMGLGQCLRTALPITPYIITSFPQEPPNQEAFVHSFDFLKNFCYNKYRKLNKEEMACNGNFK